jgi:hypothetical protein
VTIATRTLAIGANTAAFSLVDPLLFRDLPVRDPASLVQFTWRYPGDPPLNMFSLENYAQYRDRNTVFSDMVGLAPLRTESSAGREPIGAWVVTGNFFHALGVRPALERVPNVSDDAPGGTALAVVSWRYWQAHFNGEARALGGTPPRSHRCGHRAKRHPEVRPHAGGHARKIGSATPTTVACTGPGTRRSSMSMMATRGRVSRMVATSAGWLVSVGFLLGAPTAFWSTRFAARSVENLPAGGAVPIASAAAALIAVAFIAVYVPTRRATRVEPVIALRAE